MRRSPSARLPPPCPGALLSPAASDQALALSHPLRCVSLNLSNQPGDLPHPSHPPGQATQGHRLVLLDPQVHQAPEEAPAEKAPDPLGAQPGSLLGPEGHAPCAAVPTPVPSSSWVLESGDGQGHPLASAGAGSAQGPGMGREAEAWLDQDGSIPGACGACDHQEGAPLPAHSQAGLGFTLRAFWSGLGLTWLWTLRLGGPQDSGSQKGTP